MFQHNFFFIPYTFKSVPVSSIMLWYKKMQHLKFRDIANHTKYAAMHTACSSILGFHTENVQY